MNFNKVDEYVDFQIEYTCYQMKIFICYKVMLTMLKYPEDYKEEYKWDYRNDISKHDSLITKYLPSYKIIDDKRLTIQESLGIDKPKCCGRCIKGLDECIYGD